MNCLACHQLVPCSLVWRQYKPKCETKPIQYKQARQKNIFFYTFASNQVTDKCPVWISGKENMVEEIMTKFLRKICGRTEDRTRDLLNTRRMAHPTDLVGAARHYCRFTILLGRKWHSTVPFWQYLGVVFSELGNVQKFPVCSRKYFSKIFFIVGRMSITKLASQYWIRKRLRIATEL